MVCLKNTDFKKGKKGIGFYIRYFIENFVLWRTKKILLFQNTRGISYLLSGIKVENLGLA